MWKFTHIHTLSSDADVTSLANSDLQAWLFTSTGINWPLAVRGTAEVIFYLFIFHDLGWSAVSHLGLRSARGPCCFKESELFHPFLEISTHDLSPLGATSQRDGDKPRCSPFPLAVSIKKRFEVEKHIFIRGMQTKSWKRPRWHAVVSFEGIFTQRPEVSLHWSMQGLHILHVLPKWMHGLQIAN